MKLLFIYGPPAAGKLTVAKQIADRTGFRLFHNHLTIDLAKEIFEDRKIREKVVESLRLSIFTAAAKADVSLIFTMVYAKPVDDAYVGRIVNAIEDNGGQVCFVQLAPDAKEIEKRVVHSSRQTFSKIKNPELLRTILADHDLYSAVPYSNNITIDNTNLSPTDVTSKIIDYFKIVQ